MDNHETRYCIGIDLGTTNTTAAYLDASTGVVNPVDLTIMQKGKGPSLPSTILPSIMYRTKDDKEVVGNEAYDKKKNSIESQDAEIRYLENTKRDIGTKQSYTIGDKVYTPIDVATLILQHVKNYSQINRIKGEYDTVITVPANFRTDQRNDTLEAAKRAGLKNVELYDEPKAAIISFLHEESQKIAGQVLDLSSKKRILVIDIGGGTCDICVEDVEQRDDQYVFAHKAVGRDDLGGIDFDRLIGDELAKKYLHNVSLTQKDVAVLRDIGQKIKETISTDINYYISDPDGFNGDETALFNKPDWLDILEKQGFECSIYGEVAGESYNFSMTVREFFNAIMPLIYKLDDGVIANKDVKEHNKNMQSLIASTLSDYDIDLKDVDLIFMTGGMAKCFVLRAALFGMYKKPIVSPSDPFLAVSRGASLTKKYKNIDESSKDLMPNAIMMEMEDGRLETLVECGEQIPVTKTVNRTFLTKSRNGLAIGLFEGQSEFDSNLRKINNLYLIEYDSPKEIGREFTIKYTVDRTKRISFLISFLDDANETYLINGKVSEE